jgi:hypothetical protein
LGLGTDRDADVPLGVFEPVEPDLFGIDLDLEDLLPLLLLDLVLSFLSFLGLAAATGTPDGMISSRGAGARATACGLNTFQPKTSSVMGLR